MFGAVSEDDREGGGEVATFGYVGASVSMSEIE